MADLQNGEPEMNSMLAGHAILRYIYRDSRKSRQKIAKNTANFCENRKNYGKITASNHRPEYHYTVYKTQHLALTTIITFSAKFTLKQFCSAEH